MFKKIRLPPKAPKDSLLLEHSPFLKGKNRSEEEKGNSPLHSVPPTLVSQPMTASLGRHPERCRQSRGVERHTGIGIERTTPQNNRSPTGGYTPYRLNTHTYSMIHTHHVRSQQKQHFLRDQKDFHGVPKGLLKSSWV